MCAHGKSAASNNQTELPISWKFGVWPKARIDIPLCGKETSPPRLRSPPSLQSETEQGRLTAKIDFLLLQLYKCHLRYCTDACHALSGANWRANSFYIENVVFKRLKYKN